MKTLLIALLILFSSCASTRNGQRALPETAEETLALPVISMFVVGAILVVAYRPFIDKR